MNQDDRPNVKQTVPLLNVTDMDASLRFYVDGLGFRMTNKWVPDGKIRWCWLELGAAAIMIQQAAAKSGEDARGRGVSICFMCEDALAIYDQTKARGLTPHEPFVGNRLWVTGFTDPDGYRMDFESPTATPEEITLSQWLEQSREQRGN